MSDSREHLLPTEAQVDALAAVYWQEQWERVMAERDAAIEDANRARRAAVTIQAERDALRAALQDAVDMLAIVNVEPTPETRRLLDDD